MYFSFKLYFGILMFSVYYTVHFILMNQQGIRSAAVSLSLLCVYSERHRTFIEEKCFSLLTAFSPRMLDLLVFIFSLSLCVISKPVDYSTS